MMANSTPPQPPPPSSKDIERVRQLLAGKASAEVIERVCRFLAGQVHADPEVIRLLQEVAKELAAIKEMKAKDVASSEAAELHSLWDSLGLQRPLSYVRITDGLKGLLQWAFDPRNTTFPCQRDWNEALFKRYPGEGGITQLARGVAIITMGLGSAAPDLLLRNIPVLRRWPESRWHRRFKQEQARQSGPADGGPESQQGGPREGPQPEGGASSALDKSFYPRWMTEKRSFKGLGFVAFTVFCTISALFLPIAGLMFPIGMALNAAVRAVMARRASRGHGPSGRESPTGDGPEPRPPDDQDQAHDSAPPQPLPDVGPPLVASQPVRSPIPSLPPDTRPLTPPEPPDAPNQVITTQVSVAGIAGGGLPKVWEVTDREIARFFEEESAGARGL